MDKLYALKNLDISNCIVSNEFLDNLSALETLNVGKYTHPTISNMGLDKLTNLQTVKLHFHKQPFDIKNDADHGPWCMKYILVPFFLFKNWISYYLTLNVKKCRNYVNYLKIFVVQIA